MLKLTNGLGRKADQARQKLLCYILDSQLKAGDRLPTQDQLRLKLLLGTETIANAIHALAEEGILEVRNKVGIFVRRHEPGELVARLIGIGLSMVQGSPYNSMLIYYLQSELQKQSCRAMLFCNYGSEDATIHSFPGLDYALKHGQLSGFITTERLALNDWQQLETTGVQVCYCGHSGGFPLTVTTAVTDYTLAALRDIRRLGLSRPEAIFPEMRYFEQARQRDPFASAFLRAVGMEYRPLAGEQLVNHYLRQAVRPDALIFYDDTTTADFCCQLVRCHADWHPVIFALRNRQIPLLLPVDNVFFYELDIEEVAASIVGLLLAKIRNPALRPVQISVPIRAEKPYP